MDHVKVQEALGVCETMIQKVIPQFGGTWQEKLTHCLDMIQQMRDWSPERLDKSFRWLGYIQGMMHAFNVCDLEALKEMSRPTEADTARENASTYACSGHCGKQGPVPWRCAECVEGAAILDRNAIRLAREDETRLRGLIETATKAAVSSHARDHSKVLLDLTMAYHNETPLTSHARDHSKVLLDLTMAYHNETPLTSPEHRNEVPYLDPLPALEAEAQHRYQVLRNRGLAEVSVEELQEVVFLVENVERLKNMREGLSMLGKTVLPALTPWVKRWAEGAVDLRANVMTFHREVASEKDPERPCVPEEGVARRRLRLIAEEFFETMGAAFPRKGYPKVEGMDQLAKAEHEVMSIIACDPLQVNLGEFAKELADLEYVCEGAFLGFGIDSRPVHTAVQRANMAKKDGPVRADGKRGKPENWTPPDIKGIIETQMKAAVT